jgi:cell division septation protein DedD
MNENNLKEKSSLYILGKEFIIVIVVVFSALSFTLGYFVGKSGDDNEPIVSPEMAKSIPMPEKLTRPSIQSEKPDENPRDNIAATKQVQQYKQTEQQKPVIHEAAKTPESVNIPLKTNESSGGKQKGHEIIYTVQLGAFKNADDAYKFKEKYDKKGYTTYITIAKNNRNEKIYKVRMGRFEERKNAEIFSLKLKKTEGLTTFVTFKTE